METTKTDLTTVKTGLQLSLKKLKDVATVADSIKSQLPVFQSLKKTDKFELNVYIISATVQFIENNFPTTKDPTAVAGEFAEDIIEQRPDWRLPDINLFFKFIKQNIGIIEGLKTFGNIMTPIRLLELSVFYEVERCKAREDLRKIESSDQKKIENAVPTGEVGVRVKKIIDSLTDLKPKVEITRKTETMEQYEQSIIDNKDNFTEEEKADVVRALKNNYSIEQTENGTRKIYHYQKAIDALS